MSTSTSTAAPGGSENRRLAGQTLLYFAGRAAPAAIGLLSVPVILRLVGAETYGRYALYVSLALLVGNAAASWVSQSVVRYSSRLKASARAPYVAARWTATWASAAAAALAVAVAAAVLVPGSLAEVTAAAAIAATLVPFSAAVAERQAGFDVLRANTAEFVRAAVTAGLPLALFAMPALRTPAVLLGGVAAGNALGALVAGAGETWRARAAPNVRGRTRTALRALWAFGSPLAAWVLVSTLLNSSDRYLIEWLVGTEAVGVYSAVYDVVYKGTGAVLTPIIMTGYPAVIAAWNAGDRAGSRRLLRKVIGVGVAAGAAATLVLGVAAPWVGPLIVGRGGSDVQALIVPVALGAVTWQLAMLIHIPLMLGRRTVALLGGVTLALAVNVGLNLLFIPRVGPVAAAYSTVIGAAVYFGWVLAAQARASR